MTQIKNIREHIKILDKKTNYTGLISDAMKASGEVQREYKEVFSILICGLQRNKPKGDCSPLRKMEEKRTVVVSSDFKSNQSIHRKLEPRDFLN